MTKQKFDLTYRGEKVVVHCNTEEDANEFLALAHGFGHKWCDGESLLEENSYDFYQEKTCYKVSIGGFEYCDKDFYLENGYEVVEFKQEKGFNVGDVVYNKGSNRPMTILRKTWVVCYQGKTSCEYFVEERDLSKTKPLQKITRKALAKMGYELVD